jgi:RNA polymerase sigma-70 factor (ECF subfamily)
MEPTATARLIAANVESRATDIPDFDEVVQLYRPRIFRFVLASVRDRDAAETLTQDCFWKAYRGWKGFRGDASVHTWLMHIAVNVVRDFARNRRIQFWRRAQVLNPSDVSDWIPDRNISPEASAVVKDQVQTVWKATERLTAKQRTVFLLRFVEEMDLIEIAAATGMTEGTVKVHLFRAVHAIRERLRRSQ